jgi:hypothetical protein
MLFFDVLYSNNIVDLNVTLCSLDVKLDSYNKAMVIYDIDLYNDYLFHSNKLYDRFNFTLFSMMSFDEDFFISDVPFSVYIEKIV